MTEYKPLDFHTMNTKELDSAYRNMMDELLNQESYEQKGELQLRLTNVCITAYKILVRGVVYPFTTDEIYDDVLEREGL